MEKEIDSRLKFFAFIFSIVCVIFPITIIFYKKFRNLINICSLISEN
jgi:hypothetical protein